MGCVFVRVYVCVLLTSVQPFATLWNIALQAPQSMEFSRQEYWSRQSFPPPGDLPDTDTEPRSPALLADSSSSEPHLGPTLLHSYIKPGNSGILQVQYLLTITKDTGPIPSRIIRLVIVCVDSFNPNLMICLTILIKSHWLNKERVSSILNNYPWVQFSQSK